MELGRKWVNNNNHLSVLFRPLVNSVKDDNFQSTSDFYQVVRMSFEYYNAYKSDFMKSRFEGNFIETLLIQPKMYSLFSVDNKRDGYSYSNERICLNLSKPYLLWRHIAHILQVWPS